ncbi:MAG: DUF4344 domain-containing metallopeptidase [Parvularculaceae bacterium]|nr:DUF4344 domain-containing metallopeptidase [Parvularculaceae bacterium]
MLAAAVAALAASAWTAPRAQSFDPTDEAQTDYVDGNLIFLTYHEVGHMILDQLLEVDQHADRLAAEETADDVATWLMLPDSDEPGQDADILAAIEGWSRSAEMQQGVAKSPHYPDDGVRAARIACYLYGARPDKYAELAKLFRVSIKSVDCKAEVEAMKADFEDWFGEHLIPPAEPNETAIEITYEDGGDALADAESFLKESGILEAAAEDISEFVRLPNDVSIVARRCGAGAAEFRYSPSARRITACYEAVDWLMRDANDEEQEKAKERAEEGDELGSGGARVPRRPRPPRS